MHTDARTLDDHSTIEGDICIIGAGAAGISVALEWILSPYRIILLEGGGFEYEARMQELYRGKDDRSTILPVAVSPPALFWRHDGSLGRNVFGF
jgi:choline dehydrogenase-like flavoprotein